jgi:hypothetical protein
MMKKLYGKLLTKTSLVLFVLILTILGIVACSTVGNSPAANWPADDNTNFWMAHGVWLLIFMALFPRITMIVATMHPIGWLSWLGWLFTPRILAAILATHYYWDTNPILVIITLVVAFWATKLKISFIFRRR